MLFVLKPRQSININEFQTNDDYRRQISREIWAAELQGIHEKYKYERKFLPRSIHGKNFVFELKNAKVYQINNFGDRRFLEIKNDKVTRISELIVKQYLKKLLESETSNKERRKARTGARLKNLKYKFINKQQ